MKRSADEIEKVFVMTARMGWHVYQPSVDCREELAIFEELRRACPENVPPDTLCGGVPRGTIGTV
jgi:hypothetical protein